MEVSATLFFASFYICLDSLTLAAYEFAIALFTCFTHHCFLVMYFNWKSNLSDTTNTPSPLFLLNYFHELYFSILHSQPKCFFKTSIYFVGSKIFGVAFKCTYLLWVFFCDSYCKDSFHHLILCVLKILLTIILTFIIVLKLAYMSSLLYCDILNFSMHIFTVSLFYTFSCFWLAPIYFNSK